MLIYIDSREKPQAIRGIISYFDRHGIAHETRKLDTGDYMLDGQPGLVVDRKGGLQELAMNLCSADKGRFWREIRRAHDGGIRLVILCEQTGVKTLADVKDWKNRYGKVTGRRLQDEIWRMQMAYGVPVLFCDKRSTGRRIIELLTGREKDGPE